MRRRAFLHGVGTAGAAFGFARPRALWGTDREDRQATEPGSGGATGNGIGGSGTGSGKGAGSALAEAKATLGLRVTRFDHGHVVGVSDVAFAPRPLPGNIKLAIPDKPDDKTGERAVGCRTTVVPARDRRDAFDVEATFRVLHGRVPNASVAVTLTLKNWSRDAFLMIPGAVYGGNRFASRHIPYPPLVTEPSDIGPHVPPIVSDIPRLNNQSGESHIALSAVDTAVPSIAVRLVGTGGGTATERGLVLLAEPITSLGSTGLTITESADRTTATLAIGTPCVRPDVRYSLCNGRTPSTDRGGDLDEGREVTVRLRVLFFPCPDVQTLFDRWYEARRDRVGTVKLRHDIPLSVAKRLIEERLSADQWMDTAGFFTTRAPTVSGNSPPNPLLDSTFRTGADGAMALAVAGIATDEPLARKRAASILDFQLTGQAGSGLLHAASNGVAWWDEGEFPPRGPDAPIAAKAGGKTSGETRGVRERHWTHIGRNAEALHLACRQILFLTKIDPAYRPPETWRVGLTRVADAVLRLWGRSRQLGQYVNCESGDLVVGGSAAGALAPAALALAARVLAVDAYAKCALDVAEHMYVKFVRAGLTLGGAPAALQCPDSRSAAGLLESFVVLAETTGDEVWFTRATEVAHQLATWVVAWDAALPDKSTLGRLGTRTTGAVLVSVQDKWALPGFPGLSGDALFRLYRATGKVTYLELLRETVHNSSGYVDLEDRRPEIDSKAGWVAGRIPLGDVIGPAGDVPAGTPAGAAQASCLMAATEVPSIYVQPDTGFVFAFDHVDVRVKQRDVTRTVVSVTNPTRFECELRVFSELNKDRSRPLQPFPLWGARSLTLSAGATEELEFPSSGG